MRKDSNKLHLMLLAVVCGFLIWSAIAPKEYFTWFLEVAPVLIAAPILIFSFKKFRFTNLTYILITIHAIILIVGGHYTYAEMPLFDWIRDALDLSRNHYDRLGHFAQGFVPAMIIREVLLRKSPLLRGKWLAVIVTSMALAISAMYEIIEWLTAVILGGSAEAFLGTQGDVWDPQWDMFIALIGAVLAQLLLARLQDRQMQGGG